MICLSNDVPPETRDKILRMISKSAGGGQEIEKKYLFKRILNGVLAPFDKIDRIGKFDVTREEKLAQEDYYLWAKNVGSSNEAYLRIRKTVPLIADRGASFKVSYKYPNNAKEVIPGMQHRGEMEIDITEEQFEEIVANPAILWTIKNEELSKISRLFNAHNKTTNIEPLGWVYNLRTKRKLVFNDHQCEFDIDRIIYSLKRFDEDWQDGYDFEEFELELEQQSMPQNDILELLNYFDMLASRNPEVLEENKKSKLFRMLQRVKLKI